jgi:hypothetical protein
MRRCGSGVLLALAAITASACHKTLGLTAPDLDGVRSILFAVTSKGHVRSVRAVDLPPGMAPRFPDLDIDAGGEIYALEFGCSLDRLGILAGDVPLGADEAMIRLLPIPLRLEAAPGRSGVFAAAPRDPLPPPLDSDLRRLMLPPDNFCRTMSAEIQPQIVDLGNLPRGGPTFATPIDAHSTLLGTEDGHYFRVVDDLTVAPVDLGSKHWRAGYTMPDGEIWLVGNDGKTAHGRVGGTFTVVSSTTPFGAGDRRIAIRGPNVDAPFELFGESNQRVFARFDGSVWQKLAAAQNYDSIFFPAVAWLGPGQGAAIGVGSQRNTVVRYDSGAVRQELLPGDSGLSAMMYEPGIGLIAGRDADGIDVDAASDWTAMEPDQSVSYVRTLAAMPHGFMFGASTQQNFLNYEFAQWYPETGYCPLTQYTDLAALYVGTLGDRALVALTLEFFHAPMQIVVLQVTHPAYECSGGP